MQDNYGNISKNRSKYVSTTSNTFASKNTTLAIALRGKPMFLWQQVCLGLSSWSQGGTGEIKGFLMAFFEEIFYIKTIKST